LMPNHVHLIAVPPSPEALARAIGETHRHYSLHIHERFGWSGYLWQGRFASTPMDETHVFQAARYVLLNPVRAGLVNKATDWDYSSARAHQVGLSDGVCNLEPLAKRVGNWDDFLKEDLDATDRDRLRIHTRTGRPLGSEGFVLQLESTLGIRLRPKRSGPQSSV
jgi:putative transposase